MNVDSESHSKHRDEVHFKLLSDGLGFHQKPNRETRPAIQRRKLKAPLEQKSHPTVPPELAPFYKDTHPAKTPSTDEIKAGPRLAVTECEANLWQRMGAYLVDFFTIIVLFGSTVVLMQTNFRFESLSQWKYWLNDRTWILLLAEFILIYLFYFTIADWGSSDSLGKWLFKIKLVPTNGKKLSVLAGMQRGFITLISLPVLGLPVLLDFQGRLTDTKLVKKF